MAVPTEIRLDRATRVLHVSFDDGTTYALPAEYLRVESPSAEVQGQQASGPFDVSTFSQKRSATFRGGRPLGLRSCVVTKPIITHGGQREKP